MTPKNWETFWKKKVGMEKAISRRMSTAAYRLPSLFSPCRTSKALLTS